MAATTSTATAPDGADAAAAKAVASVLGKTKTPPAAPAASNTGLTLTVDAADKKSLSRSQTSAINRAQTILGGLFDVSVSYTPAEDDTSETSDDEASTAAPTP